MSVCLLLRFAKINFVKIHYNDLERSAAAH